VARLAPLQLAKGIQDNPQDLEAFEIYALLLTITTWR